MNNWHRNKQGFTLIELSIVLVIIGLIVGGVLVGRDLIKAAEVRAQIRQMSELETQLFTFRTKYDCLPGDCSNATSSLGTVNSFGHTIVNGDGDGVIRSVAGSSTTYAAPDCVLADGNDEPNQTFIQLSAAKIGAYSPVSSGYVSYSPQLASGGSNRMIITCVMATVNTWPTLISLFGTQNVITLGGNPQSRLVYTLGLVPLSNVSYGVDIRLASAIDTKIDNGIPNTGSFGLLWGDNLPSCMISSSSYPASGCMVVGGKLVK